jgi:hypothetical protein
MSQQIIGVGSLANDGTGDPLRTAMIKINENFTEIYSKDAVGSNLDISGNTISSTVADGNVEITPTGAGQLIVHKDNVIIATPKTPTSAVGASGDKRGMIAWDSNWVYVCINDFDGTSVIWRRAVLSSW